MALDDDDMMTSGPGGEGPADGGASGTPGVHDGGADGGADEREGRSPAGHVRVVERHQAPDGNAREERHRAGQSSKRPHR